MSDHIKIETNQFANLAPVFINLNQHSLGGSILDIGGGGEGIIGKWLPNQVIAVNKYYDELSETAPGPIKIVKHDNSKTDHLFIVFQKPIMKNQFTAGEN